MKILIIATPRSGSSVLTSSISRMLGYIQYQEPYNFGHPSAASQRFPDVLPENVVVKTMINQLPIGKTDYIKFYIEESKKYDKIILLSRKDVFSAYESFNHNMITNFKGNWHQPYTYNQDSFNLTLFKDYLYWTSLLIQYSMTTNIPITWYEDLYNINESQTKEIINTWDLGGDVNKILSNFNIGKKYRKPNYNSKII